jgi:hypothetical protein
MALPWEKREFQSWREALGKNVLEAAQLRLLEEMVARGEAASVEAAADLLDWKETVMDPDEHMYGM